MHKWCDKSEEELGNWREKQSEDKNEATTWWSPWQVSISMRGPRLFQCCHPSHTVNSCSTWSTVPKACVMHANSNAHVLVQKLLRWAGGMHCEYVHLVNHLLTVCIAGGANFHGKGSRLFRRNFRSFYFHRMNTGCSDHTPTSWLPCPIGEPKKQAFATMA